MTASRARETSSGAPSVDQAPRAESARAIDQLSATARSLLGLALTPQQRTSFAWYLEELLRWNARHNLTAIVDPTEIALKHFLDSLTLLPRLGASVAGRMVDVGTGAGFPGLPLRIVCPALRLTLVEATSKKADFCRRIAEGLRLREVAVLHARAEEVGRDPNHRQAYDVATARAVAALPVLVEYLLPLVRVGGLVLAQKGESGAAEAQQSARALELLGGRLKRIETLELPGVAERRTIVEIEKAASTPDTYPRRPGIPTKRPLLN
jgi:16S rRNA (guanine527-N7)-methyltransferase